MRTCRCHTYPCPHKGPWPPARSSLERMREHIVAEALRGLREEYRAREAAI